MQHFLKRASGILLMSLFAVVVAFVLCAAMLLLQGFDPLATFGAILYGAAGNIDSVFSSISAAMPLAIAAMGVIIAFKACVYNIGVEGQLFVGGLLATVAGTNFAFLPAVIHLPLSLLAGALGGALWALLPALMKIKRGFNEVITTVLMNYVGIYFTSYAVSEPLRPEGAFVNQSAPILDTAMLSRLVPRYELNGGLIVMLIVLVCTWFFINRSDWGYRIRAVGSNPFAAQSFGINTKRTTLNVFLISGALAGLAGSVEVLGNQGVLAENFAVGMGYNSISVALLGGVTAPGAALAALFMGCLRNGGIMMQIKMGVSSTLINMIQAILILTVLCFSTVKIVWHRTKKTGGEVADA